MVVSQADRILETRRALAQLYSNLSLQHLGFSLVTVIAFITLITSYDKFAGLDGFRLSLFLGMLSIVIVQGLFAFGRASFWSLVTTVVVYRTPGEIRETDDIIRKLIDQYVGAIRSEHKLITAIGARSISSNLAYTIGV